MLLTKLSQAHQPGTMRHLLGSPKAMSRIKLDLEQAPETTGRQPGSPKMV